jgi:hypothetical protein
VIFAFAARAAAAPEGLELAWAAPPGCPGEVEVRAVVEKLVGERDPKLRQPLVARGNVVEEAGRFRLELSWRSASSEAVRSVEGQSCDEVTQAGALIIALALDPTVEEPLGSGVPAEEPRAASVVPAGVIAKPEAPIASETKVPPDHAERKANRTSDGGVGLSGRAAFALDLGTLPGTAPGGFLGARLSLAPVAVVLDGLTFVPVEREVAAGAGEFWLSALSLRPCWPFLRERFRAEPCVALEAHVVRSEGKKLSDPDERWAWFPSFGLTLEAAYRLSPALSLIGGGALLASPSRPTFVIEGVPVHEPAAATGRLSLGFELNP